MSKVQFDAEAPAEEVPIVAVDDNDHEKEEDEEPEKNSKSFKESMASFINAEGRPIQWIYDRCNGHERVMDPDSKPCCCLMFPNGFLKLAPGLLESNPFMECFGRIGFIHPEWFQVRKVIFLVAMLMSTIGWSCILLTDLSISKDFKVLQHFHFSKGDVKYGFVESENGNLSGLVEGSTRLYVGLSAVAWEQTVINVTFEDIDAIVNANPGITEEEFRRDFVDQFKTKNQFVTGFDEFCDGDSRVWFVEEDQCDKCEEASTKMIRSIIMATVFYFFTFKNDWLRFWVNYDVNCQKFMSVAVACITVGLALRTFFTYRNECFDSFHDGDNCFFINGTRVDCTIYDTIADDDTVPLTPEEEELLASVSTANLDWDAGPCYILLGGAVFIRLFSMLCNLTVPTPPITRNREMQWEYERIAQEQDAKEPNLRKSEYFAPW